jgi:hypothetical protein
MPARFLARHSLPRTTPGNGPRSRPAPATGRWSMASPSDRPPVRPTRRRCRPPSHRSQRKSARDRRSYRSAHSAWSRSVKTRPGRTTWLEASSRCRGEVGPGRVLPLGSVGRRRSSEESFGLPGPGQRSCRGTAAVRAIPSAGLGDGMAGWWAMGAEATFGDLLRAARLDAGLTQEELAERATLSPRSISDLELGVNRNGSQGDRTAPR